MHACFHPYFVIVLSLALRSTDTTEQIIMRLFDFPNVNDSHPDLLGGLQIGPAGILCTITQLEKSSTYYSVHTSTSTTVLRSYIRQVQA
ncbi:hypothetical protein BJX66DRAFT_304419 [Aspergillus keveii]|uniref:Secreted protein n=1 Tax=Aspergillus keveii TaxID=714993 RepID=A0ABR4G5I7_9EURO